MDDLIAGYNRAISDIDEVAPLGDEAQDAVNLVVDTMLHCLEQPESGLVEAMRVNYGD